MALNNPNRYIETTDFKWEQILLSVKDFKEKIEAMIIGWAIWDALGIPVEMKTHTYIKEKHWKIDDFLDSSLNIFFNKWGLDTHKKWLISDDTILTFAWIESIIETWKIDFNNLLKTSTEAYKNFPYWFWKWTTSALKRYEELEQKNPWNNNYIDLGAEDSAWNWVIMKQSPYSAYFLAKNTKENDIDTDMAVLTQLTHRHPTAIVASLVHNKFLMELLKTNKEIDLKELLGYLIEYSKKIEANFLEKDNDKISDLLINLLEDQENWGLESYDEILNKYGRWEQKVYASGYVITTIWIVYSLFLNKQNFDSLLDSINIGWDTDTFWAIIWNMIWAYKAKFYSEHYENGVASIEKLKNKTSYFNDNILEKNSGKEFIEKINKLKKDNNDIFYNSKGSKQAYKLFVRHLWYAGNLWYWKKRFWKFIASKDFYLADFDNLNIQKIKTNETLDIIELELIKDNI